jgi:hypothetical protein
MYVLYGAPVCAKPTSSATAKSEETHARVEDKDKRYAKTKECAVLKHL